jgi:hypothetical protein
MYGSPGLIEVPPMDWGLIVPNVIATAGLILSLAVAIWQRKIANQQAALQLRLAEIEEVRFGTELADRNSAQLSVHLSEFSAEYDYSIEYPSGRRFKGSYWGVFGVSNAGPVAARDIRVSIVSDPPDRPLPYIERFQDGFGSIPYLDPDKDDAFPATATSQVADALWVRLQWVDGRGPQDTNHRLRVVRFDE